MTEPEAELQATANLSPVSPSPLHTAAPRVVPALQDTVDTIDAMVAAAANVASSNGVVDDAILDPAMMGDAASANGNDHVVDDDSLDGAYDDQDAPDAPTEPAPQPQLEPPDSNDDYAKTFDSPIDPEEGGEQGFQQQHHVSSSSMPPKSTDISLQSDHLNTNRASAAAPDIAAHDASTAQPAAPAATPSGPQLEPTGPSTEPSQPPAGLQQQTGSPSSVAQPEPIARQDSADAESQNSSVDIQKLVADLTAQPTEPSPDPEPSLSVAAKAEQPAVAVSLSSPTSLPSSSSLPPRPPLPQSGSQSFVASGAPGTSAEAVGSIPLPPAAGLNALPVTASMNAPPQTSQAAPGYSQDGEPDASYQRQWDQFMTDERQYMSDAKWDRFPEGSRIFIGNLSSDKVSKRDVFDVFHKYGRLAQISLKSAYGFVQYHTVDEGRQAMENLQGIEIKGRRIHLEISRVQDKSKKDRARSPERGRGRDGGGGGRRNEKHHQGRDDYRPGRNQSPRRHDSGRGGRGRSRSPEYGRKDRESYRRRSPSPYGRSRNEPELDLPRRYGADVPDVQIILQPEVNRDFVTWVEAAFKAKGLKTEVMYLHPRFPKDQVIQRQAAEGVYGVIDLDLRAQSVGRIPVQAFDRSGGGSNVRFDQYVDLDPGTAAEVIVRSKATAAANYGQGYAAAAGGYSNPYSGQHQQPPHGASYPGSYPPPQQQQQQQQQQQHAPPAAADIASLMGQVDNATLQRLLASMQGPTQAPGGMPAAHGGYGVNPPTPATANPQVDIQAILGSLGGATPAQQHAHHQGQYGSAYSAQPPAAPNGGANAAPAGGDAAAQVQNIMAQLARYRQ
ncbi:RNA recognition motif domain-containing protein [Hirsutella rhossiliensis]|uniref:RNA recognition motif domain-containing protein n=1 Tax=Hirsutella rhossiliensis TaxID=111463 RepID=A0A9P8MSM9_9HYPO|nr:RNA recognition motif domain-containing protein [Hirsutella rhossiliensis]KAH0959714.1 RNA recognition motif domain-containing protein [Hirsutella rhossiliensis]